MDIEVFCIRSFINYFFICVFISGINKVFLGIFFEVKLFFLMIKIGVFCLIFMIIKNGRIMLKVDNLSIC